VVKTISVRQKHSPLIAVDHNYKIRQCRARKLEAAKLGLEEDFGGDIAVREDLLQDGSHLRDFLVFEAADQDL